MECVRLIDKAKALAAECRRLREEVDRLRQLLLDNDIDPMPKPAVPTAPPRQIEPRLQFTTEQKIALFRSLFRGREDVYAVRWESPDGRHGYSPVSQRDWKAYNAASPDDRKRVDKETRKYLPLTDQAIHNHLAGKQTLGIYPLLRDETCWFLAVDFDKQTWREDTSAFLKRAMIFGCPLRSNGHVLEKAAISGYSSIVPLPPRSRASSARFS